MYKLFQKDAVEFLQGLDDESVDLIVTDIAYSSLEKHRKIGTTTRLKKDWFDIFPGERMHDLFDQFWRVLKKKSHFYFFCDFDTMRWMIKNEVGERQGFYLWKSIIWDKRKRSTGYHYAGFHEKILFFEKGTKKWNGKSYFHGTRQLNSRKIVDILPVPAIRTKDHYPTEKPVELMDVLIRQSTQGGNVVIDPFMGSCPVGLSAINHNCDFLGNDNSERAVEWAKRRLDNIQMKIDF